MVIVNLFFPNPKDLALEEQLKIYDQINDYQKSNAKKNHVYYELLKEDSLNIDYHFNYLITHFNRSKKKVNWEGDYDYRDDNEVINRYRDYAYQLNDTIRDIGYFGLGIAYHFLEIYAESGEYFRSISNPQLKHLNFLMGGRYFYHSFEKSEEYYWYEINLHGPTEDCVRRLSKLYVYYKKYDKLERLIKDPETGKFVDPKEKRLLYFKKKEAVNYFSSIFLRLRSVINIPGLIGALSILIIWFIYLTKLHTSIYKRWYVIVIILLLGGLFAFSTSVLTDYIKIVLGFKLNGEVVNDFLYCVFAIGMVEELVKIIPFFLFVVLYRGEKEPIDYIIFACISALGFAFVENILYFDQGGLITMQGRALSANVFHMFSSSLVAYGFVIGKFSKRKNVILYFLLFFFISSLAHGFYDFWLVNPIAQKLHTFTFAMLLVSLMVWTSIINNCLNNSFNESLPWNYEPYKLNRFLLISLSAVFLLEYLLVAYLFGADEANSGLWQDFAQGLFLLVFLTINLSKFDYIPKYWGPLKFWDWDIFLNIPRIQPKFFDLNKIIGARVEIMAFGHFGVLNKQLPIQGEIVSRHLINWEKDWYLVKLDREILIGNKKRSFLIVKCRNSNEIILDKDNQVIQVRQVNDLDHLSSKRKLKRDFLFIDLARIYRV